jgi:hypothetical protein
MAYLLTGIAAVSIGRDPNGIGGRIAEIAERLRARRTGPPGDRSPAAQQQDGLELEEVRLVGAHG